jgi:hypothetical protein
MSQTLLVKCCAEIRLAIVEHTPFGQAEFKTVPPNASPLNLGQWSPRAGLNRAGLKQVRASLRVILGPVLVVRITDLGYQKTPFEKQMLTLYAIKPKILSSTGKSLTLRSGKQFS